MPLVSSFHFGQYHQRLTLLIISIFTSMTAEVLNWGLVADHSEVEPSDRTEKRSRASTQRFYVHLFGPFLTSIVKIRIIHG